jgi:hypothetical protein
MRIEKEERKTRRREKCYFSADALRSGQKRETGVGIEDDFVELLI